MKSFIGFEQWTIRPLIIVATNSVIIVFINLQKNQESIPIKDNINSICTVVPQKTILRNSDLLFELSSTIFRKINLRLML